MLLKLWQCKDFFHHANKAIWIWIWIWEGVRESGSEREREWERERERERGSEREREGEREREREREQEREREREREWEREWERERERESVSETTQVDELRQTVIIVSLWAYRIRCSSGTTIADLKQFPKKINILSLFTHPHSFVTKMSLFLVFIVENKKIFIKKAALFWYTDS